MRAANGPFRVKGPNIPAEGFFRFRENIFGGVEDQVAGEQVYATRAAEGNLDDVLIMDKSKFVNCIEAGLVKDISDRVLEIENLKPFRQQIDAYNQSLGKGEGVYYGIPAEMTDTSAVGLTGEMIYSSPQVRWDLYKAAGILDGLEYDKLFEYDCQKWQVEVDAKIAAVAE